MEEGPIMPFKSAKQRKAMYAAASGNSMAGISKTVARKFIKDSGGKTRKKKKKRPTNAMNEY